jgi:hypothetical protein
VLTEIFKHKANKSDNNATANVTWLCRELRRKVYQEIDDDKFLNAMMQYIMKDLEAKFDLENFCNELNTRYDNNEQLCEPVPCSNDDKFTDNNEKVHTI